MNRRTFLEASGLAATAGVTTLAGCSGGERPSVATTGGSTPTDSGTGGGTTTGGDGGGGGGGGQNTVAMVTEGSEYYFDPIGLFVEPGSTVTFRIESGAHTSTAYQEGNGPASVTRIPEGAQAWDSGTLTEQGATFEHTFETAGTYDYYCVPHKTLGMVGRIVVGEPGGPAEGSMPPDGEVPQSGTIVEQGAVSYEEFTG